MQRRTHTRTHSYTTILMDCTICLIENVGLSIRLVEAIHLTWLSGVFKAGHFLCWTLRHSTRKKIRKKLNKKTENLETKSTIYSNFIQHSKEFDPNIQHLYAKLHQRRVWHFFSPILHLPKHSTNSSNNKKLVLKRTQNFSSQGWKIDKTTFCFETAYNFIQPPIAVSTFINN